MARLGFGYSKPSIVDKPCHLLDFDFDAVAKRIEEDGVPPVHSKALWRALYRGNSDISKRSENLPPPVDRWLGSHLGRDVLVEAPSIAADVKSNDGHTRKVLLRLFDGSEIETVIMGYPGRYTACLSTQVGCAMGCVFCATGQMGFVRQLRPGEIVSQILVANRLLAESGLDPLRNIVLMGMGEPLHNYENVMRAMRIVSDRRGIGIAESRITVSTVGVVPAIDRFADDRQPYNLAVSLHATNDSERSALVPVNSRWPLADLMAACRRYSEATGRRVLFGWTLIDGKNDTPEHAKEVASLLKGMKAHVNLIRLNPTHGYEGRPTDTAAADRFSEIIQAAGLPCTLRQRRGIDVAAGCGQLRAGGARLLE